jgi:hypothetical protein
VDKTTIVIEKQRDGKMPVTSRYWDGEKIIGGQFPVSEGRAEEGQKAVCPRAAEQRHRRCSDQRTARKLQNL